MRINLKILMGILCMCIFLTGCSQKESTDAAETKPTQQSEAGTEIKPVEQNESESEIEINPLEPIETDSEINKVYQYNLEDIDSDNIREKVQLVYDEDDLLNQVDQLAKESDIVVSGQVKKVLYYAKQPLERRTLEEVEVLNGLKGESLEKIYIMKETGILSKEDIINSFSKEYADKIKEGYIKEGYAEDRNDPNTYHDIYSESILKGDLPSEVGQKNVYFLNDSGFKYEGNIVYQRVGQYQGQAVINSEGEIKQLSDSDEKGFSFKNIEELQKKIEG